MALVWAEATLRPTGRPHPRARDTEQLAYAPDVGWSDKDGGRTDSPDWLAAAEKRARAVRSRVERCSGGTTGAAPLGRDSTRSSEASLL